MPTENCLNLLREVPQSMKAARLYDGVPELKLEEIAVPVPGPDDYLIQVMACGVCGSDVHITLDQKEKVAFYPMTPGHESAGVVARAPVGGKFKLGDAVIVSAGTSCQACSHCDAGKVSLCSEVGVLGFVRDGAYAQYVLAHKDFLFAKPQGLSFAEAAIVADAVSTPYHALAKKGKLAAGENIVITGVGGLGLQAVKIAKALGAKEIIVVDLRQENLELALSFGATHAIHAQKDKNLSRTLRKWPRGIQVAVDFTGNRQVQESLFRGLGRGGRLVMVGIGYEGFSINYSYFLVANQLQILGSFGCDRDDIPEIVELWQSGALDLSSSVSSTHPLEDVNQCLYSLQNRKPGVIRQVVLPHGG